MHQLARSGGASLLPSHLCKDEISVFQHERFIECDLHLQKHFTHGAPVVSALCLPAVLLFTTSSEVNDLVIEHLADRLPDLQANPLTGCLMAFWLTGCLTD